MESLLTKEQKIEAYERTIVRLKNKDHYSPFVCDLLYDYLCEHDLDDNGLSLISEIRTHFPELRDHEPSDSGEYLGWWPENDIQSRIDVIEEILKELKS